jgi:hypothetical protein
LPGSATAGGLGGPLPPGMNIPDISKLRFPPQQGNQGPAGPKR